MKLFLALLTVVFLLALPLAIHAQRSGNDQSSDQSNNQSTDKSQPPQDDDRPSHGSRPNRPQNHDTEGSDSDPDSDGPHSSNNPPPPPPQ